VHTALSNRKNGKVRFQTAKTRSWEKAERLAREELSLREPAMIKLRQIEERDAEKIAGEKAKNITIKSACDRWFASQKLPPNATAAVGRLADTGRADAA